MAGREYICGYPKCLHHGEKVKQSEAVMVGNRRYHWDCAELKEKIKNCIDTYMEYIEDKTKFPVVCKIINVLVFNNKVPIDFIRKNISTSKKFYQDKPVHVLYGLRKLYWEKEFKMTQSR